MLPRKARELFAGGLALRAMAHKTHTRNDLFGAGFVRLRMRGACPSHQGGHRHEGPRRLSDLLHAFSIRASFKKKAASLADGGPAIDPSGQRVGPDVAGPCQGVSPLEFIGCAGNAA